MRVAVVAALVVAAGCGGQGTGAPYAGISSYDAASVAQDVLADEREDDESPFYGRKASSPT